MLSKKYDEDYEAAEKILQIHWARLGISFEEVKKQIREEDIQSIKEIEG